MNNDSLPKRLKLARELAGLKGRELDRLAGLGEGHVSMIETGERPNPDRNTSVGLSQVLGISLDWLLLGKGAAPTEKSVRAAVAKAHRAA